MGGPKLKPEMKKSWTSEITDSIYKMFEDKQPKASQKIERMDPKKAKASDDYYKKYYGIKDDE